MDPDRIDGRWNEAEGAGKQRTGAETDRFDGAEAEVEGRRYDQSGDDARRAVDNWLGSA